MGSKAAKVTIWIQSAGLIFVAIGLLWTGLENMSLSKRLKSLEQKPVPTPESVEELIWQTQQLAELNTVGSASLSETLELVAKLAQQVTVEQNRLDNTIKRVNQLDTDSKILMRGLSTRTSSNGKINPYTDDIDFSSYHKKTPEQQPQVEERTMEQFWANLDQFAEDRAREQQAEKERAQRVRKSETEMERSKAKTQRQLQQEKRKREYDQRTGRS